MKELLCMGFAVSVGCFGLAAEFPVTDYGAKADGTKCTEAFAKAIAACAEAGGGRVTVPSGTWFTGPIHLRSNIELHLEDGAVLEFSDDPKDCLPAVMSSWEGLECVNYSPLVYAYCCTNVAITGKGTLAPRMKGWDRYFHEVGTNIQEARGVLYKWGAEDYPVEKRIMPEVSTAVMRPQLIQMNRSVNVLLEGITVRDSPFWTIHLFQSENVTVRNVTVRAHGFNNDGLDIEMTRNVLVENCDITAGDDGFVLKAGRNRDAWRINRPTENVEIRNCRIGTATALLAVGSELSGGIRNVYVHDCEVGDVARLFYVKTNHRRGGFVDRIRVRNVKVNSVVKLAAVETEVLYQWSVFPDYERRLTRISNLSLENVECAKARYGIDVKGDGELPIDGLTLRDVRIGRLMHSLSCIDNVQHVQIDAVTAGDIGKVSNYWDRVMPFMPEPTEKGAEKPARSSAWKGKKVAFLGRPPKEVGLLAQELGIDVYLYGPGGLNESEDALAQAKELYLDLHWYVDAIFIYASKSSGLDCYLRDNFKNQQIQYAEKGDVGALADLMLSIPTDFKRNDGLFDL